MMRPHRPRPLCAICADRVATTITDWECASGRTRTIVACWPCLSPVPDPPEEYEPEDLAERVRDGISAWNLAPNPNAGTSTRGAVMAVVRKLGKATNAQIRAELRFTTEKEQNHISQVLSRLARDGYLAAEELVPGSPTSGRVYQVAKDLPPQRAPRPSGPHVAKAGPSRKVREAAEAIASIDGEFTCAEIGMSARMITAMHMAGIIELVRAKRANPYRPAIWRRIASEARRAA